MDANQKTIFYEVTLGAVFKMQVNGQRSLMAAERKEDGNWTPARNISDDINVYSSLGVDQVMVVRIAKRDEQLIIRDLFSLTVNRDGDSSTVGKAIKDKVLIDLLENGIKDWKKGGGMILDMKGNRTILSHDCFRAMYAYEDRETLRKSYRETLSTDYERTPADLERAVKRFEDFLAKFEEKDELYWFVYAQASAARIGYAILREGRLAAALVEMMG